MSSKDKKNITKNQPQQKKPTLKVSTTNQNKWIWVALGVVLLTTFAIYFKAIKFDFLITWDDPFYIRLNREYGELLEKTMPTLLQTQDPFSTVMLL